jgi:putative membrane protein
MTRKTLLLASVALGFALAGGAQAQTTMQKSNQPANPPAMQNSSQIQSGQKADKASQSFIKSAIEGNYAEINVGKLAQEKGKSSAVKQFGKMLVDDHTAANEKAIAAAKEIGVTPPTGSSVMEKGTYLKLKVLTGDTFDKSFASSMVSDHKADIKEFQKESSKTDAAGQFAKDTLPTLQKHLQEAQKIQQETQTTGSK